MVSAGFLGRQPGDERSYPGLTQGSGGASSICIRKCSGPAHGAFVELLRGLQLLGSPVVFEGLLGNLDYRLPGTCCLFAFYVFLYLNVQVTDFVEVCSCLGSPVVTTELSASRAAHSLRINLLSDAQDLRHGFRYSHTHTPQVRILFHSRPYALNPKP